MAAMDEFRAEREAIKHGTWKQKLGYFWDYYKWHTIIIGIVVCAIISITYNIITQKDKALSGILLNAYEYDMENPETNLVDEFIELANIDTSEYEVILNTGLSYLPEDAEGGSSYNYSTSQVITAQSGAGELDFVAGPHSSIKDWAYKGLFLDLRKILTDEQLKVFEPYFLYIDEGIIEQRAEAWDKMEDVSAIAIPESLSPEGMSKPVPVMLDMTKSQKLLDAYGYDIENLAIGVVSNASNVENTLTFLEYLLK